MNSGIDGHREQLSDLSLFDLSCACANARRTARAVTQLYDEVLSPSGLSIAQFIILHVLARLGPLPQHRLSDGMGVAVETLSRRLAVMRRHGWIELQQGKNRREHVYALTDAGKKKFEATLPFWVRAQKRLEAVLGGQQMRHVLECLNLLTKASQEAAWARLPNIA